MNTTKRNGWLFLREAGLGTLILGLCGLGWLHALATAVVVAALAALVRSVLTTVDGGRGSILVSLTNGFVVLGGLLSCAGWTLFFVRRAFEGDHAQLIPAYLLIYGVGLLCAALAGGFVGALAMVFLGPVIAFPYHLFRALRGEKPESPRAAKPRKKDRTKKGNGGKGRITIRRLDPPSTPVSGNPGSSLAFE